MAQNRDAAKRLPLHEAFWNVFRKRVDFLSFVGNAFLVKRYPRDAVVHTELIASKYDKFVHVQEANVDADS